MGPRNRAFTLNEGLQTIEIRTEHFIADTSWARSAAVREIVATGPFLGRQAAAQQSRLGCAPTNQKHCSL